MIRPLPCPIPGRFELEGKYARLEPLDSRHSADLYKASAGAQNKPRFDYLFECAPERPAEVDQWLAKAVVSTDPLYFAVIDRASGRCEGRQALMRITPDHGVIELGSIYWGPAIARTRVTTEACYLHLQYAFDTLGYRRFEWKCNDLNEPSKRSALRFGFTAEGVFRQHMVSKNQNRDTAWFSIIDTEWPEIRNAFERWLAAENFNDQGIQRQPLEAIRTSMG